jgi:hypothetical protein
MVLFELSVGRGLVQINADMNQTSTHRQLKEHHGHHRPREFDEMDQMWESMSNMKNPQEAEQLSEDFEEVNIQEEAAGDSKHKKHHGHHHKPTKFEQWFTRKHIYEMVAPKLWKYACEGDEYEEPAETPEDAVPKKGLGVCPVMVLVYIMMIADLYLVKSLKHKVVFDVLLV